MANLLETSGESHRVPDVFDIYQALWRTAQDLGATVLYNCLLDDGAGQFDPNPSETGQPFPRIWIGRCELRRAAQASLRAEQIDSILSE